MFLLLILSPQTVMSMKLFIYRVRPAQNGAMPSLQPVMGKIDLAMSRVGEFRKAFMLPGLRLRIASMVFMARRFLTVVMLPVRDFIPRLVLSMEEVVFVMESVYRVRTLLSRERAVLVRLSTGERVEMFLVSRFVLVEMLLRMVERVGTAALEIRRRRLERSEVLFRTVLPMSLVRLFMALPVLPTLEEIRPRVFIPLVRLVRAVPIRVTVLLRVVRVLVPFGALLGRVLIPPQMWLREAVRSFRALLEMEFIRETVLLSPFRV